MKYKNYVKVDYINGVSKYVTRVSGTRFFTDDGTEALAMGINSAKDMVYGMACNLYHAHVEIHPDYVVLTNPYIEGDNVK